MYEQCARYLYRKVFIMTWKKEATTHNPTYLNFEKWGLKKSLQDALRFIIAGAVAGLIMSILIKLIFY